MKKLHSENIEQIINSFEAIEKASPSAFFYSKLIHKMQKTELKNKSSFIFQFKPLFVIASLFLLVIMNAFMLIKQTNYSHKTVTSKVISANSSYNFSEDYQLNTTTNY